MTGLSVAAYGTTVHFDGTFEGITESVKSVAGTLTLERGYVKVDADFRNNFV